MLLDNLVLQCDDKRPSMLASTHITFDAVGMDRRRSLRLQQRGGTQNSIPDAPEESLPQNPLQKEVILDLLVCVEGQLQAKVDQSRQESMFIVSNNREKSKQLYAKKKVEA